ncbi:lysine--tRNA ligase [Mycoplasmopsis synoviae]|uniref:Lysine--tRNA ligase n=1 Tax=Mycoplasmopsis synoviae TaxID=2109 RepID=A0AAX3EZD9_MYCSY|nr:lysine--tRNA ligase [Mycoplasmopsis synoviae]QGL45384.1 lysine--tRNA ligase [Mycoplasmopsis synoviae]QXV99408.1 lysine--tRNA ligase [Mycoplasmopsis synoviae]UBM43592.1 lysine--tRNA ligase [Mycoplasmopsis synoviae]ULL02355.1 lysine--tRNA ligase [Mycoplasmopsis synoviae]UZW64388.1 lysine--tRNA ligase [Mycoplasmopsis synoviae]
MSIKLTEQEQIRLSKLDTYKKLNINPFEKIEKNLNYVYSKDLKEKYSSYSKEELESMDLYFDLYGRITSQRGPFIVIKDYFDKIQLYFNKKEHLYLAELVSNLDLGDIIHAHGKLSKTNTGELVVKIKTLKLLTKALKPLPDKFHGLSDIEEIYRHRYLDLISNEHSMEVFKKRSKIISLIRKYFDSNMYLEVETPFLSNYISGASAKPFKTFHNALSQEFTLRIATEIPLKKLLIGGIDRVYEMGRIFRNEGIDTTHNPEFTTIEFYEAYSNLEKMMQRTEELFKLIAKELNLKTLQNRGEEINLEKPFKRVDMIDEVSKATGVDFRNVTLEKALELAKEHGVKLKKYYTVGHIANDLFEKLIEKTLVQPTFVMGHPIEISPLTYEASDPRYVERAELFINGKEYANMYTELSSPIEQLKRFEDQLNEKAQGNDESSDIDWDFIEALKYGMPPAGGCGIGIDRLVMLFTEKESIRDVLFFPTLKNKKSQG